MIKTNNIRGDMEQRNNLYEDKEERINQSYDLYKRSFLSDDQGDIEVLFDVVTNSDV